MLRRPRTGLVVGLVALLAVWTAAAPRAARAAEGFTAHLEAVKSALQRGELQPGQWIVGTDRRTSLQSLRTVALDLAPFSWAEGFTMRVASPAADDALVAAGVALAFGRPSLYLVNERKDLPWFLREADLSYPGQVAIIEGADPLAALETHPPVLRPGLSSRDLREPNCEGFIGCIMSGLTDLQLAEGRAHLLAIDAALREHFGCRTRFCEGIRPRSDFGNDHPKDALVRDVAAIRNTRRCVFYAYDKQPRPSGMWVEAGVALALDRPTAFLVPDVGVLPPSLRRAYPTGNARVQVYGGHQELLHLLKSDPRAWLSP